MSSFPCTRQARAAARGCKARTKLRKLPDELLHRSGMRCTAWMAKSRAASGSETQAYRRHDHGRWQPTAAPSTKRPHAAAAAATAAAAAARHPTVPAKAAATAAASSVPSSGGGFHRGGTLAQAARQPATAHSRRGRGCRQRRPCRRRSAHRRRRRRGPRRRRQRLRAHQRWRPQRQQRRQQQARRVSFIAAVARGLPCGARGGSRASAVICKGGSMTSLSFRATARLGLVM